MKKSGCATGNQDPSKNPKHDRMERESAPSAQQNWLVEGGVFSDFVRGDSPSCDRYEPGGNREEQGESKDRE